MPRFASLGFRFSASLAALFLLAGCFDIVAVQSYKEGIVSATYPGTPEKVRPLVLGSLGKLGYKVENPGNGTIRAKKGEGLIVAVTISSYASTQSMVEVAPEIVFGGKEVSREIHEEISRQMGK